MENDRYIPYEVFDGIEEKYGVTREALKKCLLDNWDKCESYVDIWGKVSNLIPQLDSFDWYKKRDDKFEKERDEYFNWYGLFYDNNVYSIIRDRFILCHGKRHTLKEAASIAADVWVKGIFHEVVQDNGDSTWHSVVAMYLSSKLKMDGVAKYSDSSVVKEGVRKRLTEYYKSAKWKNLAVDYWPQQDLYDILVESGIDKKTAETIAPIKTAVEIDTYDNSVVISKHGKQERK